MKWELERMMEEMSNGRKKGRKEKRREERRGGEGEERERRRGRWKKTKEIKTRKILSKGGMCEEAHTVGGFPRLPSTDGQAGSPPLLIAGSW